MHILFVHQNFPAQFGHVAENLTRRHGWRCAFATEKVLPRRGLVEILPYKVHGGATVKNHYCARSFENATWRAHAVYEALKARPDIRPDLIVGHSGFGSTLFLKELYDVPIINYFEYFYRNRDSDMDFRPDFPSHELSRLRSRARNATLLLDLDNCDAGYSPTVWQKERFPKEYQDKIRVIFDGVDVNLWRPLENAPRRLGNLSFPPDVKIVTYATRGMESMRGFDVFMKAAKRIADRRRDVVFLIAGEDRVCYGGDSAVTGGKTFKQWVLDQDDYDLSRFHFLNRIPPPDLAHLFNISDLHIYLTVPFVLSWSLMNALACGAAVLASDTAPVREMIRHGENGLLTDFFDAEAMADAACEALDAPDRRRALGRSGAALIRERFSLDHCLPLMKRLFEDVRDAGRSGVVVPPAGRVCRSLGEQES